MPIRYVVFLDFDNTITTKDVLDDLLLRFSKDDKWLDLEKRWKNKEIGSKECLKGQMEGIRITKRALDGYLSAVKIDRYFKRLIKLLGEKKIKTVILSDNFDYILNRILKNNRIEGMDVYSNRLEMRNKRLIPRFPFSNSGCGSCAHCKKTNLRAHTEKGAVNVYVGDGLSDVCAAKDAEIVFAKDHLKEILRKEKLAHIPIEGLDGVYKYFKGDLA